MDWNDLRLFLAVARHGSIRGAAQELCVNQSTVNRRMDVLEHDLNLVLFDRTTRGFMLTEQGRAIAAAAAPMQEQSDSVLAQAERLQRNLAGTLKITAPQTVGVILVMPIIEVFRRRHPDVMIHYDASERRFDLNAGEADIAFRAGLNEPDASLVFDLVHVHKWAVYCSPAFAKQHGMPTCTAELRRFPVVALGGAIGSGPLNAWFMSHVDPARISGIASSIPNMASVLHAGLGLGILPMLAGHRESSLIRCFGPIREIESRMWLVTTHEARHTPRVAAFVKTALKWFHDGNGLFLEGTDDPTASQSLK